ncbi:MAG: MATE family efflux transporter [Solobacterium sp.]|nr:MATE family efflux transporter [Solobacterium sp.]
MSEGNFTQGKILMPLLKFAVPVLLAMFLQSLYGAVDLMIVGRFAESMDISAVSTGSQIMMTITQVIAGLSMGTTILLGQQIGRGEPEEAGRTVGTSILFFGVIALVSSAVMVVCSRGAAALMNAPAEAFDATASYILICSAGLVFITAYNLVGALFRGLGNSRIPLITVAIAAVTNIALDLLLVARFHMGAAGAAYATVLSQAFSVILSLWMIRSLHLPFTFTKKSIRFDKVLTAQVVGFGMPIALADFLVGISFLIILAIVNSLGLLASAGMGVAEKVCGFIMLVPSAFGSSMASFVAQNYGARQFERARKALKYGIAVSFAFGVVMAWLSFFHGDLLCGIFSKDAEVTTQGWEYLKAYAIDCLFTAFFFCYTGYFNGCGYTKFVMTQSIIGAFGVRVPVSFIMSRIQPVSLFKVGLATPASSLVQTILCIIYMRTAVRKKEKEIQSVH